MMKDNNQNALIHELDKEMHNALYLACFKKTIYSLSIIDRD